MTSVDENQAADLCLLFDSGLQFIHITLKCQSNLKL